jgi:hypothetical protein
MVIAFVCQNYLIIHSYSNYFRRLRIILNIIELTSVVPEQFLLFYRKIDVNLKLKKT